MSVTRKIKAEGRKRTGSGVLNAMRREGWVPAVIYGVGAENQNIKVKAKAFTDLLTAAPSAKILLEVELENGTEQLVFIQDLQHDALTDKILHADFLAVTQETEVRAALPLVLVGEPAGVKLGGALEQTIYKIPVRTTVKNLPETIETDVTALEVSEQLRVGGVTFPEGVTPTLNEKVVVGLVAKTRAAASAAATGAEA